MKQKKIKRAVYRYHSAKMGMHTKAALLDAQYLDELKFIQNQESNMYVSTSLIVASILVGILIFLFLWNGTKKTNT